MDEGNINEVFCISPEEHNSFVMKGFRDQLVDGKNCDLEIRLRDSNLFVHKCLVDIFFTKIGADLEDDRFYLDLKEFPKKLITPLVDMMYHGVLSVPKTDIWSLRRLSSIVGYAQAREVLAAYLNGVEKSGPTVTETLPEQISNTSGFVIKSEPPDDELDNFGLINHPGYIAETAREKNSTRSSKKSSNREESNCIYEVFTPNPQSLDKNVREITSDLKFKEDIGHLSEFIRDKDKAQVTITENPYEVVSKIVKQNELIIPKKGIEYSSNRPAKSLNSPENVKPMGKVEVKRRKGPYSTSEEQEETDVGSQITMKKTDKTSRLFSLQRKVDQRIASRSVDVSVMHVQSPGPKANRCTFDGSNEKNFEKAAANRMLQNSIMSVLASKAKTKSVPGGTIKELTVKARLKDDDDAGDDDLKTTGNESPQKTVKKTNKVVKKKILPNFAALGEDIERSKSGMKDVDLKTTGIEAQPRKIKTTYVQSQERRVIRRKRPIVNYNEEVEPSDSEDEEQEIGDYLLKKKRNKVKYFPPAGIVPEGCKSTYAQSCFTKTKTITETLTTGNSNVMVIRKEVPIRHTIYNAKKAEPGVAAVVVCHPTKPVVRY